MLTQGNLRQDRFTSFTDLADAVKRADQQLVRNMRDDRDSRLTVVSEPGNSGAITNEVERTGTPKLGIQGRQA